MVEAGLIAEAEYCYNAFILKPPDKKLLLPALNTVGYSELFDYFKGLTTFPKAIDLIKQHTRNYAKRQLTWFRKDNSIMWLSPDEFIRHVLTLQ
jgi:tRNA dimethylallyltransferase